MSLPVSTQKLPLLKELFIDGKWTEPAKKQYMDVINPYTEEVIQQVASGSIEDVNLAVAAARKAFDKWNKTSGKERAVYLRAMAQAVEERAAQLSILEANDCGRAASETAWDMEDVVGCFQYYATAAEKLDSEQDQKIDVGNEEYVGILRYEAAGIVAAVIPWNYPLLMALWKVAPALAAGCTIILKPSELTPLTALQLAQIAKDCSLPDGVLNVVTGLGPGAGAPLVAHPNVDKVAFTGSVPTGSKIMSAAAQGIKNISLELGGKSPALVFDTKNIDRTVEWIMFGIFGANGQVCSATSRLLLQEDIAEEFIDRLVKRTEKVVVGNPLGETTKIGPLVSKPQQLKVLNYIDSAVKEGAKIATPSGPCSLGSEKKGYFVHPTILTDVQPHMKVWKEEIFGPVLSIMTFNTEEEGIQLANDSEYGLAGAVFTSDNDQLERVTKALRVGIVWNNCSQPCFVQLPWGGMKKSGVGRELGPFGLHTYLEPKQVCKYVADKDFGWYLAA